VWGGQIELEAIQACKLVICLLLGEKDREWQLGADFHDNNRSSKGNIQYHPSHWLNISDILKSTLSYLKIISMLTRTFFLQKITEV
jgi:hypothetical protein